MNNRVRNLLIAAIASTACLGQCGCLLTTGKHAIPVRQLPMSLRCGTRSEVVSLSPTLLEQKAPAVHVLGPGDVVSIYIQGVLPPQTTETPVVQNMRGLDTNYYPPNGNVRSPSLGVPLEIDPDGYLSLPLVGKIRAAGLTVPELENTVRDQYVVQQIINKDRERMYVTLIRTRVHRILVIREDAATPQPQLMTKSAIPYTRRGSAQVVDLPVFENDVLHALVASGGMPGIDAENEVWVLRGHCERITEVRGKLENGKPTFEEVQELTQAGLAIRIPLTVLPDEELPFGPDDVILHEGDIVYVPPRNEYFYTAGLLMGGKIPLPRDDDLDVLEAIAVAGGSTGGTGEGGAALFRSGGVGSIIPPSLVVVVRKLPNGQQIPIRVNLTRAMQDVDERLIVQPDDVVFLHYTHKELIGNILLNFFNFNFLISPEK